MTADALLNFGNNCNHLKDVPRFYAPHNVDHLPNFIQEALKKCEDFYFKSKEYLTNLQLPLDNERLRVKRSERREAISLTMQALFNYMNIGNGEVGFWTRNTHKIKYIHCEFLARKTGLKRQRLYRAIADLKRAGYLVAVHTKKRSAKGLYRSVKFHITQSCLRHLGFSEYRLTQVRKFKERVLRSQAPNSCEYQPEEIKLASAETVHSNVSKMREMFKSIKQTANRHKEQVVQDFTGCASRATEASPANAIATPIQSPLKSIKTPSHTAQSREKMRQQVAQVLHLVKNGASQEEARKAIGI